MKAFALRFAEDSGNPKFLKKHVAPGRCSDKVRVRFPHEYASWKTHDPTRPTPGGESIEDCTSRILECCNKLVQLHPEYDYALGLLLYERMHICDWREFESLKQNSKKHLVPKH